MNQTELKKTFDNHQLDVIISASDQTRLWYTKINASAGFLFIDINRTSSLLIDARYIEIAEAEAQNVNVKLLNSANLKDFINQNQNSYRKIGVESDYLTLDQFETFKSWFKDAEFVLISGQKLREIKSDDEVKLIKKASQISLEALEELKPWIKPGVSENTLEQKLEMFLRQKGANKSAFDAIVVSGERSSLPHGKPTERILQDNELVTIDFGAQYQGYASDISRTFVVGTLTNPKLLEIQEILITAQQLGIKAVKPGVKVSEIDKVCRDYITKKGYGPYFVHSTGHGLGIDVHELPSVSPFSLGVLKQGMVITVEPGIYLPGIGGIRIEDDVLVTESGFEVLSKL